MSGSELERASHRAKKGTANSATQRPATFSQTARAVAWSFFGVRRKADYEDDVAKLNPVHVIIGGIIGAALFVVSIVLLVRWVVSSGVAA